MGAARVFGYRLMENFDRPYAARSVSEFWKRWHISLSTWFRDYLYFPLGGSRVAVPRWILNVLTVFVVSGLWHGANWTFLAWGLLHGLFLVISRLTEPLRKAICQLVFPRTDSFFLRVFQTLVTFHLVLIGWIVFRSNSLADASLIFQTMFATDFGFLFENMSQLGTGQKLLNIPIDRVELIVAGAAVIFLEVIETVRRRGNLGNLLNHSPRWTRWAVYYAAALIVAAFGQFGASAFIYFQF